VSGLQPWVRLLTGSVAAARVLHIVRTDSEKKASAAGKGVKERGSAW
jgi:hypothetical protein